LNIFVTGASGFIGTKACPYLHSLGHKITAFSRSNCNFHSGINYVKGDKLSSIFSKEVPLKGIDCILHLAGKSHITNKMSSLETLNYIKDNVNETLDFAERCSKKSIKRFIFVSSIKVNGESTNSGIPFRETDIPKPSDAYAIIKYQIELGLFDIAKNSKMEVVIIRPPLMYGPGVKGYFGQLLDLIKKNIPLPLKSLDQNLRSFIYLENFLNFLGIVSFSYSTTSKPFDRFTAVSTLSANLFPIFEFRITLSTIIEISCLSFLFKSGNSSILRYFPSTLIFVNPRFL